MVSASMAAARHMQGGFDSASGSTSSSDNRMVGRGDPEQRLLADHLDIALAAMGDDAEVDIAGAGLADQLGGLVADHRHLDARIGAGEAGQHLGQKAVGIIVRACRGARHRRARRRRRRRRVSSFSRIMRRAKPSSRSPSSVSLEARPSRSKIGLPMRSSSRRICIDTADWVLNTASAARVKLPVSTMR